MASRESTDAAGWAAADAVVRWARELARCWADRAWRDGCAVRYVLARAVEGGADAALEWISEAAAVAQLARARRASPPSDGGAR